MRAMATIHDFEQIDIRVGRIIAVEDFPEAKKPAFKLTIDFGPDIGIKRSSARFTHHHTKESLTNVKILGVVNLGPRVIGPFVSEVLTLGVPDAMGETIAITPIKDDAIIGGRLY